MLWSFVVSGTLSSILFGGLQLYRESLAQNWWLIVLAGFLASWMFVFLLTCLGNMKVIFRGRNCPIGYVEGNGKLFALMIYICFIGFSFYCVGHGHL